MQSSPEQAHHRFCLIIGAGPSGLIQASDLLRKSVLTECDIQIFERGDGVGGVWNQARYPGAACDVFAHVYQLSWFPKSGMCSWMGGLS